jgi:hypothetical protein
MAPSACSSERRIDVSHTLDVPVLLVIYRRPDLTARVLDAIAAAQPRTLFVAADGPASDREAAACEAARRVVSTVTWPCQVTTNFAAANLGSRLRVSSALDWFFGACEAGIVLEDDCVPSPDFFRFCSAMLERYRDDQRIVHVSGETYRRTRGSRCSYYFSKYALSWGWATWRRAWRLFDLDMHSWPTFREQPEANAMFDSADERAYWHGTFQLMYDGKLLTAWDYAWLYACMTQGLSIHPAVNLVTNIGSGSDATHTQAHPTLHRHVGALETDLRHPDWVVRDRQADLDTFDLRFPGAILKHQRTWRHQAGRPRRWATRLFRRALGRSPSA